MKRALLFCCFALLAYPSFAAAANVVIDQVWDSAPMIAYELPETDGREEAIRYVQSMRDQFKKDGELLDVAANRSSLKARLKKGFILYTTLSEKSELLRLATRKSGLELGGGSFHWHTVTAPASEAKVILVGSNPYSGGFCVIYAAGSNRALVGINDDYDGSSSYDIFQGSRLLREGYYDEKFFSVERISAAAALKDVKQFFDTLKRVHPNLLGKVTADGYGKLQQNTVAGVTASLDSDGDIQVERLASLLYYAAAFFRDGHTAVSWLTSLNEWNSRNVRFPAWRLRFDNGRFVIAAARDKTLVDKEVLEINRVPVAEFLRPILDRCSGETNLFRVARFLDIEPFWYYLTNLFGTDTHYALRVRDGEGQDHDVTLEALNLVEYMAIWGQDGAGPFRPNNRGTEVEFFNSGATAHVMYSSFTFSAGEKKKVDQVFRDVRARGARNLILDLRGNRGGVAAMGEYLFRYLYDGKFRPFSTLRARTSWDILPEVPWWWRPLVVVLRGRVVSFSMAEHREARPESFFPGRVYLLTDNSSYSMATEFAAMFRDYKVGTILGYETGGLPHTFGGPHHFILKNSRIPCNVAWTELLPPMPWPGDDEHGVIPDVPLSDQRLGAFRSEKDPPLAFTLDYIRTAARAQ